MYSPLGEFKCGMEWKNGGTWLGKKKKSN